MEWVFEYAEMSDLEMNILFHYFTQFYLYVIYIISFTILFSYSQLSKSYLGWEQPNIFSGLWCLYKPCNMQSISF